MLTYFHVIEGWSIADGSYGTNFTQRKTVFLPYRPFQFQYY